MLDIVLKTPECEPKVGTEFSAGMDLRMGTKTAAGFSAVRSGETLSICTGVKIAIPVGWVGIVAPRSGLGILYKLKLDNTIGVIDSDYRGYIKVIFTNCGQDLAILPDFTRICQMIIVPHYSTAYQIVDKLDETDRGEGGFGSSGTE